MKKLTALVLALVLILAMTACVRVGPVEAQSGQAPSPSDGATEDQVYIEPDPTDRETAVRMLNHDPETDALWRALAQKHTDATGIRVIAMTAARGYYDRLLPEQLRGSSPVTLFFAAGPEGIPVKSADLSGTAAYAALTDPTLALTLDGQVVGLPFHTESYGLLVNIVLLEKAGFTAQDLLTLEGLEQVVTSVTGQTDDLGFRAFAVPALGTPEFSSLLYAAAEGEAEQVRPLLELALNNCGIEPAKLQDCTFADTLEAFRSGEALFCLAFSGDMEALDDVRILPIPTATGCIIGLGTEGYWCINSEAAPADTEAAIAFLDKALTEEAQAFEDRCLPYGEGTLDLYTRQALALETHRVPLDAPDEERLAILTEILATYALDPSEENWVQVRDAFRK